MSRSGVVSIALGAALAAAAVDSRRMADGRQWTIRNVSIDVAPSYCYEDKESNCELYGRLYVWESAKSACRRLGDGWRLPTDDEWRRLAKSYGGVSADSEDRGKAAYRALVFGGSSGFGAVLGGGRDEQGGYARGDAHGLYWTATESEAGHAFFYNFGKGGLALHRQTDGETPRAFSVRCVRE